MSASSRALRSGQNSSVLSGSATWTCSGCRQTVRGASSLISRLTLADGSRFCTENCYILSRSNATARNGNQSETKPPQACVNECHQCKKPISATRLLTGEDPALLSPDGSLLSESGDMIHFCSSQCLESFKLFIFRQETEACLKLQQPETVDNHSSAAPLNEPTALAFSPNSTGSASAAEFPGAEVTKPTASDASVRCHNASAGLKELPRSANAKRSKPPHSGHKSRPIYCHQPIKRKRRVVQRPHPHYLLNKKFWQTGQLGGFLPPHQAISDDGIQQVLSDEGGSVSEASQLDDQPTSSHENGHNESFGDRSSLFGPGPSSLGQTNGLIPTIVPSELASGTSLSQFQLMSVLASELLASASYRKRPRIEQRSHLNVHEEVVVQMKQKVTASSPAARDRAISTSAVKQPAAAITDSLFPSSLTGMQSWLSVSSFDSSVKRYQLRSPPPNSEQSPATTAESLRPRPKMAAVQPPVPVIRCPQESLPTFCFSSPPPPPLTAPILSPRMPSQQPLPSMPVAPGLNHPWLSFGGPAGPAAVFANCPVFIPVPLPIPIPIPLSCCLKNMHNVIDRITQTSPSLASGAIDNASCTSSAGRFSLPVETSRFRIDQLVRTASSTAPPTSNGSCKEEPVDD